MKFRQCLKAVCVAQALSLTAFLGVAKAGTVNQIKVQPDKAPDSSSLKSIVESVTRGCETNDDKAIALYNYCMLTNYHLNYPTEPGGIPALKEINDYGWSLCGGLHTVESALWITEGWGYRYVGWTHPGHTTVEANYDGKWHYLDIFLKFYAWMPDGKGGRTIAGQEDLKKHTDDLLTNAFVMDKSRSAVYAKDDQFVMIGDKANWQAIPFLTCGDPLSGVASGVHSNHIAGMAKGWGPINHDTGSYSTDVDLAPGVALTNGWDEVTGEFWWNGGTKPPAHTCSNHKDTRNDPAFGLILEPYVSLKKARGNGVGTLSFNPDFSNDACLKAFASTDNVKLSGKSLVPADASKPASVVFDLSSPYIMIKANGVATGADSVEISSDGGKTFAKADVADFTTEVKGKDAAQVKITFKQPLTALSLKVDVQNNPGALPYLSPGKNIVAVSVADPKALGANKLVITYAYSLRARTKSFEQICEKGAEIAKQQGAKWDNKVTYVQKTYTAADLPAKFEVDCPTPKGEYPVYPRMIFMRREVISPTSSPLPLPEGAVAATAAPADELQTLPNPFLIGTRLPAGVKAPTAQASAAK